jgi:alkylation response protein AidB-like acyl-CoA dehydrogenase
MDLAFTEEHARFRRDVRAWIEKNLELTWSDALRDPSLEERDLMEVRRRWQAKLNAGGYLGMAWPREWGGRGASAVEEVILHEELSRADAPEVLNTLGLGLCAPALIHHGTEEQRRRYLPPMLSGEEIWCQGFSEPGAGSDLASLRLRAELSGDHFILNGQKCWTTFGPYADWIFVLARTDPDDRYGGISFILVDLKSPGIEVRPLRQITGESEFGEVFMENVSVPRANLVGEVGQGWQIAMTVLGYERGASTMSWAASLGNAIRCLVDRCRELGLMEKDDVRRKLGKLVVDWQAFYSNGFRTLANIADGKAPGPESSIEKLFWSELDQRLRVTALEILGPGAQLRRSDPKATPDVDWARTFLYSRAETIFSGSSEIQRNIIAKRVLGLPQG